VCASTPLSIVKKPQYNAYSPKYGGVPCRFYAVPAEAVTLNSTAQPPFYTIQTGDIQTIAEAVPEPDQVFRVEQCVGRGTTVHRRTSMGSVG